MIVCFFYCLCIIYGDVFLTAQVGNVKGKVQQIFPSKHLSDFPSTPVMSWLQHHCSLFLVWKETLRAVGGIGCCPRQSYPREEGAGGHGRITLCVSMDLGVYLHGCTLSTQLSGKHNLFFILIKKPYSLRRTTIFFSIVSHKGEVPNFLTIENEKKSLYSKRNSRLRQPSPEQVSSLKDSPSPIVMVTTAKF